MNELISNLIGAGFDNNGVLKKHIWTLTIGDLHISTHKAPNAFHRFMQKFFLGFNWAKILDRAENEDEDQQLGPNLIKKQTLEVYIDEYIGHVEFGDKYIVQSINRNTMKAVLKLLPE